MASIYRMKRSEDTEQIQVIQWARLREGRYPELEWLCHIPNGGSRNKAEAVKLKQMGVKPGIPDLFLPVANGPYHGLFIEMKYGKNTLQDSQRQCLRFLLAAGYHATVCYSAEITTSVIENYIKMAHLKDKDCRKSADFISGINGKILKPAKAAGVLELKDI